VNSDSTGARNASTSSLLYPSFHREGRGEDDVVQVGRGQRHVRPSRSLGGLKKQVYQNHCIEVGNSNHPDAGLVTFTRAELAAFLAGAKAGEFDQFG
jgi:hypothetical protein